MIVKAGLLRDLGQASVCSDHFATRKFNSQLSHVITERAAEMLAENARQVCRVHTNFPGNAFNGQVICEIVVQHVPYD